jgi:hypothetical protein
MHVLETEVQRLSLPGAQSEPTTPPEYREQPVAVNRSNRMSVTSLSSLKGPSANPISALHRNTVSNSQHGLTLFPQDSQTPDQSVPGSRRNSDEEEEEDDDYSFELPTVNRRAAV